MSKSFEEWWDRIGFSFAPDTSDVPWYDKRKGLAEAAFEAARAQSGNYVCDQEIFPQQVNFANGRIVAIKEGPYGYFLGIAQLPATQPGREKQ